MKYIYQEPVVTTISDKEITEFQEMKDIFLSIKDGQYSIYMEFYDVNNNDYCKSYDNVRVTDVKEETVDLHIFLNAASVRYRDIPFLNIRKVKLVANKNSMSKKYKISRWRTMDVAELGE